MAQRQPNEWEVSWGVKSPVVFAIAPEPASLPLAPASSARRLTSAAGSSLGLLFADHRRDGKREEHNLFTGRCADIVVCRLTTFGPGESGTPNPVGTPKEHL